MGNSVITRTKACTKCGLRLNPEQRATGYQFNTYTAMEKHK